MSKYFITPNFPDFNSMTFNSDFEVYSTFYLHNSSVVPDLGRGQDYSFVSSLGLSDNTVYWVLTFDDYTNYHYFFIDIFACLQESSEQTNISPNQVYEDITLYFEDSLLDSGFQIDFEIRVFKEQILSLNLSLSGSIFTVDSMLSPLFIGSYNGVNFSFIELSKRIFNLASTYGLKFFGIDGIIEGVGDSNSSNETPLNGVVFKSLNGADGSYADGTPVTVTGRDGAFKVLASRNFYNDSKDSQNMLIYLLERTDLEHKPTMLVADVYVKKVVVP